MKPHVIILLSVFFAVAAARGAVEMFCQDSARVDSDGTLHLDSSAVSHEFGWRRYAMTAGGFVPGERYRVTFKARVEGFGSHALLFVLVRPKGRSGDEKDLASLKVRPTEGVWKDCEMMFDGGEGLDYRVQFHGWNRIKADIADLKIEKRPPFAFGPAARGTESKGNSKLAKPVPPGAVEFEVEAPRNATGPILDCAAYG